MIYDCLHREINGTLLNLNTQCLDEQYESQRCLFRLKFMKLFHQSNRGQQILRNRSFLFSHVQRFQVFLQTYVVYRFISYQIRLLQ